MPFPVTARSSLAEAATHATQPTGEETNHPGAAHPICRQLRGCYVESLGKIAEGRRDSPCGTEQIAVYGARSPQAKAKMVPAGEDQHCQMSTTRRTDHLAATPGSEGENLQGRL